MDGGMFEDALWSALDEIATGLLACTVGDVHALPMTAHFDGRGPLHFYAPADGKLVSSLADSHAASFYYAGPGHHLFATLHGALARSADEDARHRFWTPTVESWFPGCRDDAAIAFLRFDPAWSEVWLPGGDPAAGTRAQGDLHHRIDF